MMQEMENDKEDKKYRILTIGGYKYNDAIEDIFYELRLVNKILDKLVGRQVTDADRLRFVAQALLSTGRALEAVRTLEKIGKLRSKERINRSQQKKGLLATTTQQAPKHKRG